eukprot:15483599-Alexandrium_andersonii.AAC.1
MLRARGSKVRCAQVDLASRRSRGVISGLGWGRAAIAFGQRCQTGASHWPVHLARVSRSTPTTSPPGTAASCWCPVGGGH